MMEGIFLGIAGGSALLVTRKACTLCRSSSRHARTAGDSSVSSAAFLSTCWAGVVRSTRDLFAECRAELEASRIAVEEVRAPSSSKVVRIY